MGKQVDVIVAGHICLDMIPTLAASLSGAEDLFLPGQLVRVGPATLTLGGAVANTGIALHRLGATTKLMGKVGDDLLGTTVLESLRKIDRRLAEDIIVASGEPTSYTIVISPPGVDRSFLHCSGANDTFSGDDLEMGALTDARLVHFGYPPLMQRLLSDGGEDLAQLLRHGQRSGALVSLDMAMPDVSSTRGHIDWKAWLSRVLPAVDFFLPSFDEILFMLDPARYQHLVDRAKGKNLFTVADLPLLQTIADQLIELGSPLVAIKLGDCGLYLQTHAQAAKLLSDRSAWQGFDWQAWQGCRLWAPCFDVEVVGTTGAGDCTIAGLLMALLHGLGPASALRHATAVGAWCVQSRDATSNIPAWSEVGDSMLNRWPLRKPTNELDGWTRCQKTGVYMVSN